MVHQFVRLKVGMALILEALGLKNVLKKSNLMFQRMKKIDGSLVILFVQNQTLNHFVSHKHEHVLNVSNYMLVQNYH